MSAVKPSEPHEDRGASTHPLPGYPPGRRRGVSSRQRLPRGKHPPAGHFSGGKRISRLRGASKQVRAGATRKPGVTLPGVTLPVSPFFRQAKARPPPPSPIRGAGARGDPVRPRRDGQAAPCQRHPGGLTPPAASRAHGAAWGDPDARRREKRKKRPNRRSECVDSERGGKREKEVSPRATGSLGR